MNIVAVGAGGFIGAIARYVIGLWIPATNGFPYGTLVVNLLGCFFLAWFFTVTTRQLSFPPQLKLAIGAGFTGSFTTFSTFSVETLHLFSSNHAIMAFIYVLVSTLGGLGLTFLGVRIAAIGVRESKEGSAP